MERPMRRCGSGEQTAHKTREGTTTVLLCLTLRDSQIRRAFEVFLMRYNRDEK